MNGDLMKMNEKANRIAVKKAWEMVKNDARRFIEDHGNDDKAEHIEACKIIELYLPKEIVVLSDGVGSPNLYCPNCESEIDDYGDVCDYCGQRIYLPDWWYEED